SSVRSCGTDCVSRRSSNSPGMKSRDISVRFFVGHWGWHGRMPGHNFFVDMQELPASVFQEELALDGKYRSKDIYEQHGSPEKHHWPILMNKNGAVRDQEP